MDNCVFGAIRDGERPAHIIWEDDNLMAFLDAHPFNSGHTLLIAKKHIDYIFDLDDELYSAMFLAAKRLSKPLKKATDAIRIGVAVEGLAVPHVHIHLVPISKASDLNPQRARDASDEELAEMCEKIRKEIFD